jgi:hypothetical protein
MKLILISDSKLTLKSRLIASKFITLRLNLRRENFTWQELYLIHPRPILNASSYIQPPFERQNNS